MIFLSEEREKIGLIEDIWVEIKSEISWEDLANYELRKNEIEGGKNILCTFIVDWNIKFPGGEKAEINETNIMKIKPEFLLKIQSVIRGKMLAQKKNVESVKKKQEEKQSNSQKQSKANEGVQDG